MRAITASPAAGRARAAAEKLRGFPVDGQRTFLREVTEKIGFDYNRGRIDVSLHADHWKNDDGCRLADHGETPTVMGNPFFQREPDHRSHSPLLTTAAARPPKSRASL